MTIQNYKRNVLRTPANNKIRLDDERGKEHIKVSTEYGGKSQLNLGHLVDAGKQQRGEGFELRTDMWGAVRAKKGIFISADAQDKAQGQVLDMTDALAQLREAQSLVEALCSATEVAKAELADLQTQKVMMSEALEELKKSAMLLSAPEGIAQVTPKACSCPQEKTSLAPVEKFRFQRVEEVYRCCWRNGKSVCPKAGDKNFCR